MTKRKTNKTLAKRRITKVRGGVWITAQREIIPIQLLKSQHIIMILRKLEGWGQAHKNWEFHQLSSKLNILPRNQQGLIVDSEKAKSIRAKMDIESLKTIGQITEENWPVYIDLRTEAERRDLEVNMTARAAIKKWGNDFAKCQDLEHNWW